MVRVASISCFFIVVDIFSFCYIKQAIFPLKRHKHNISKVRVGRINRENSIDQRQSTFQNGSTKAGNISDNTTHPFVKLYQFQIMLHYTKIHRNKMKKNHAYIASDAEQEDTDDTQGNQYRLLPSLCPLSIMARPSCIFQHVHKSLLNSFGVSI